MNQSAHVIKVAFMRAVEHRAGAEKQQPLEQCVVERVVERGHQTQRAQYCVTAAEKDHRQPQPHQDDADVLDRVIGEQALQIVLHNGVQHAKQRRSGADD